MTTRFDVGRHTGPQDTVRVVSGGSYLDLGHLRALVAASADIPDTARVTFGGVRADHEYVDERTAREVHVRNWTYRPVKLPLPEQQPVEGG